MELARPQTHGRPSVASKPRLRGLLLPSATAAPASMSSTLSNGVSSPDGYTKSRNNNLYKASNPASCKPISATQTKWVKSEAPATNSKVTSSHIHSAHTKEFPPETKSSYTRYIPPETRSYYAKSISTETQSSYSKTVSSETQSSYTKFTSSETQSSYSKSISQETQSSYSKSISPETQSSYSKSISPETQSSYTKSISSETQSSFTKSISPETQSSYTKSISPETQSSFTKSISPETQSSYTKSISPETQSSFTKSISPETQSSFTKSISPETQSSFTKPSFKSPDPPPLPSLPPPTQRKGPFPPSSCLSLPASFRSRKIVKTKLQTSPTIDSFPSSLDCASLELRSTKSLARNVSPLRRTPPALAPKPRHLTAKPHQPGTSAGPPLNNVPQCNGNTVTPVLKDVHVNLPGKHSLAQPNIESNSPSTHSLAPKRPVWQRPPPVACPETFPNALPSPMLKPTHSTNASGSPSAHNVQDTQNKEVGKSSAGKQPSTPPPLPKNPPLTGVSRQRRISNIKSTQAAAITSELEDSQQTPHSVLPQSERVSISDKPPGCESSIQARTVSDSFNHSVRERLRVHSPVSENVVTEHPGSNKKSNFVNIFGTGLKLKLTKDKTTEDHVSKTRPHPKPAPRSHVSVKPTPKNHSTVQPPFSTSHLNNFPSLYGHHIDNKFSHNSTTHSTKCDNRLELEPQLRDLQTYSTLTGHSNSNSYFADKDLSDHEKTSSLFEKDPEETSDMLREIEELLKNKLGDTQFNIEDKSAVDTEVEHFNKQNLGTSSTTASSPSRLQYRNNISTEIGSLESLNTSINNFSIKCLATACLAKTSAIIAGSDKVVPSKPKRTYVHRPSHTSPDITSVKLETCKHNNSSSSEWDQRKVKHHYQEHVRKSDSPDFCPPLPPRNKPTSTSLKESCETAPSTLKKDVQADTGSLMAAHPFAARGLAAPQSSKSSSLQLVEPESKTFPHVNQARRSKISRDALPPPPPGPPKRSATFSPGDGKSTIMGQGIGQMDIYTDPDAASSAGSLVLKKSSSFLLHRQSKDRLPSATSMSSNLEGSGKIFEPQSPDEIVSSGTDTEPEPDEEEIYVKRKAKKVFFIAKEIVSSESTFVDVLRLLNLDFRVHISKATEKLGHPILPSETLNKILNFLPQLQHLNEELLRDLNERIDKWDRNPRLADIFVKKGPFLKLYSSYIRNFESACSCLDDATKKNSAFAAVVRDFEMSPRCAKLALKHYMLKPIQRIPQYKLLLQDYLKHLSIGSPDYKDTINALNIVSEVADHANDSMRYGDNLHKLLQVQRSLIGQFEVIQPGRVLVKQGELQKLSRKEMHPRMFFLFNDVLLYTTPYSTGFKINNTLPLTGMKVISPKLEVYKFEFNIISIQRSFTLCASSFEEKEQWVSALEASIEDNAKKHHTFQSAKQGLQTSLQDKDFVLGHKAPLWVPDARVTMCMLCLLEFSLTLRRHHCRSCGRVVCFHCSENKAPLEYIGYHLARVCDSCFDTLKQEMTREYEQSKNRRMKDLSQADKDFPTYLTGAGGNTSSLDRDREDGVAALSKHGSDLTLQSLLGKFQKMKKSNPERRRPNTFRPSVLKEVHANDTGSDMCGYLHACKSRRWKRLWFVVKAKVLYTYKASEVVPQSPYPHNGPSKINLLSHFCADMAAVESMPLLGYEVTLLDTLFEGCKPDCLFELSHKNNQPLTAGQSNCVKTTPRLVFRTDSAITLEKWVTVLKEACLT